METITDIVIALLKEGRITWNQARILITEGETYYVVERNNRYVDGVFSMFADNRHIEKEISTTKSLLDCDRYKTHEEAQKFADKYNCTVRKVIVRVEE